MEQAPSSLPTPGPATAIRHAEIKALFLLALTVVLACGFLAYVMYARGVFESTQRLVLMAEDGEGVFVGMDLTFSGFPIGRVQRIELAADGKARIELDVPRKDARWLRTSSVFTLERELVGGARLRAFSGLMDDPPLPEGAVRPVLRGDATEDIPRLVATMKSVLENVERMSAADSSINASLANVKTLTERVGGRYGALDVMLGGEEHAKKVIVALDRANALLASLDSVSLRIERTLATADRTLGKAEERVFGSGGVMDETQKAVVQLNAVLGDARESLKKADAVLADAQSIGASARAATEDLGALRAEVDASLRKVGHLIDEINRKWPFARDSELKLR